MLPQPRFGGRRLDHRAVGRKIAAQHRQAAVFHQRLVTRQDHVAIENLRARDVFTQRAPIDRTLAK